MPRSVAVLVLLLCALLWGVGFLAMKSAMTHMGPFTFTGIRYLMAGIFVLPIAILEYRRKKRIAPVPLNRRQRWLLALLSALFLIATYLQQAGLITSTVTNGGFLTALYVLFVPVIAFAVTRHRPHGVLYLGVPMALIGIYCLNGGKLDGFVAGDFLLIASAAFWAGHMFTLGTMVQQTALPFTISTVSFFVAGLAAVLIGLAIETPDLTSIGDAWLELIYSGLIATGVALSLQAVAQRYVPPANAAIIIGAESLFAALAGALFRDERLTALGYAGAALIFCAIVLVEAWPAWRARSTRPARPDPEPGSA